MRQDELFARSLNTYQLKAAEFAVFGDWFYPALGLCDEAGELLEKSANGSSFDEILAEAGDVLWYASAVAKMINVSLGDIYLEAMGSESRFDLLNTFPTLARDIAISAAKVIGKVKKVLRGDHHLHQVSTDICSALESLMMSLVLLSNGLRSDILAVGDANIKKLESRKRRGVIKGSGDNR